LHTKHLFLYNLTTEEVYNNGALIGNFLTPADNKYSVWVTEKIDGSSVIVLIDENDNEIAGIMDSKTGNFIYLHPRSIDTALKLWNI